MCPSLHAEVLHGLGRRPVVWLLEVTTGEAIAIIDGDGQIAVEDIVRVYRMLKSGDFDFVATYRRKRYDGLFRLVISRLYNRVLRGLFRGIMVRDANGKPKVFTRRSLERLRLSCNDWFIDAEITIQASRLNLKIGEIESVFYRNEGRASFITIKEMLGFIWSLVRYRIGALGGQHFQVGVDVSSIRDCPPSSRRM
jgi:hypothetical protein